MKATAARVYTPTDVPMSTVVFVDGRQVYGGIRACPAEGWVDVLEFKEGDNFDKSGIPYRKGSRLAEKRLTGDVVVKDEKTGTVYP